MYNVNMSGFGALIEGAMKGSNQTRILQKHLKQAGYDPGKIDGSYGTTTQAAMHKWQQAQGYPTTTYPDVLVLQGLGVPVQDWVGIAEDTGTPEAQIGKIKLAASSVAPGAPAPELPLPTEPATVTLPSGEQVIVEKAVETVPAAAMVGGTKAWFKKNWPYLAVGGGVGVLAIAAAAVWTRKQAEQEAPAGLSDWAHPYSYHRRMVKEHTQWMREHEAGKYGGKYGRTEPGARP